MVCADEENFWFSNLLFGWNHSFFCNFEKFKFKKTNFRQFMSCQIFMLHFYIKPSSSYVHKFFSCQDLLPKVIIFALRTFMIDTFIQFLPIDQSFCSFSSEKVSYRSLGLWIRLQSTATDPFLRSLTGKTEKQKIILHLPYSKIRTFSEYFRP